MRKLAVLMFFSLSLISCSIRKSTYIQTIEVGYTKNGMKISPVGKAVKADSTNLPDGKRIEILIKK